MTEWRWLFLAFVIWAIAFAAGDCRAHVPEQIVRDDAKEIKIWVDRAWCPGTTLARDRLGREWMLKPGCNVIAAGDYAGPLSVVCTHLGVRVAFGPMMSADSACGGGPYPPDPCTPVPEPASMLGLGAGVLVLLALGRARSTASASRPPSPRASASA